MNALASTSMTGMFVMAGLAAVFLIVWGYGKYKEAQKNKQSAELRQIYASVNTQPKKSS
jgi:hypothetical protein